MTRWAVWIPYAGTPALLLATLLLAVACAVAYLGRRLRSPLRARRPGACVGAALVVIWLFGVTTFVIAVIVYMRALHQQSGQLDVPASPIAPVTAASGLVTFVLIVYLVGRDSLRVAVGSALVGTTAAPMIFEVPFALIVMWRMCSPSPPLLYTLLYFLPLLMIAVTSFAMLALSPATHLTRYTLFSLAAMFFVFAIWAIFGFGYPSDPLSAGLNMIGKVLAFVVAGSLFLPDRSKPPAPGASRSPSSVRRGVRRDRRTRGSVRTSSSVGPVRTPGHALTRVFHAREPHWTWQACGRPGSRSARPLVRTLACPAGSCEFSAPVPTEEQCLP